MRERRNGGFPRLRVGLTNHFPGPDVRVTVGAGGFTHSDRHSLSGKPGALNSSFGKLFLVTMFRKSHVTCSPFGCWNHSRAGSIQTSAHFCSFAFFHNTSSAFLNSCASSFSFG